MLVAQWVKHLLLGNGPVLNGFKYIVLGRHVSVCKSCSYKQQYSLSGVILMVTLPGFNLLGELLMTTLSGERALICHQQTVKVQISILIHAV